MAEVYICVVESTFDVGICIEVFMPFMGIDIWAKAAPAKSVGPRMLMNNMLWLTDSNSCALDIDFCEEGKREGMIEAQLYCICRQPHYAGRAYVFVAGAQPPEGIPGYGL